MRKVAKIDGSYRVATKEHMSRGNTFITGTGQRIRFVHGPMECKGQACVVHNPSNHHMRSFPTHWRADKGLMERICPHGVGHPDPDDMVFWNSVGSTYKGVHGCDGCCHEETTRECMGATDAAMKNEVSMGSHRLIFSIKDNAWVDLRSKLLRWDLLPGEDRNEALARVVKELRTRGHSAG